jgi:hypothetical protein
MCQARKGCPRSAGAEAQLMALPDQPDFGPSHARHLSLFRASLGSFGPPRGVDDRVAQEPTVARKSAVTILT